MRALVATWRGECPKTSIWPLVGYSRPSINLTVVDLPEPFGPSRPKTSPRRTSKSTPSTARAFGRPQKSLKTFVRPRTATMVSSARADDSGFGIELGCGAGMVGIGSLRDDDFRPWNQDIMQVSVPALERSRASPQTHVPRVRPVRKQDAVRVPRRDGPSGRC